MIEVKKISKSFDNKKILDEVSFNINKNEITFIVGTSGAGKTTLLNIIGGLLKQDSGQVLLDGKDISSNLDSYRANNVGFIFQDFNLINGLSIKDNIKIGTYYSNSSDNYNDEISNKLLDDLDIKDSNQKVETLSGGEKQRSALARSLIKESKIIIADEPTGNLDSKNAINVLELLKKNKNGRHIIVVSHDMNLAKQYANRIIEISDGTIINDTINNDTIKNIEDDICAIKENKKNNHLKANLILGLNGIKKKIGKIVSIVLVIAIAISSLVLVLNINSWGKSVSTRTNKYYLETDLITIGISKKDQSPWYFNYPFSDNEIKDFKEEYLESYFLEKYYSDVSIENFLIGNGYSNSELTIKQIGINDYYKERVLINDIEGKFPENDDEIIISEEVSNNLFNGAGIGENITLFSGEGASIECKISGINHSQNPFGKQYTFVGNILLKELAQRELENNKNMPQLIFEEGNPNGYHFATLINTYDANNKPTLIVGDYPSKDDEIIISKTSLEKSFGLDWISSYNECKDLNFVLDYNGRTVFKIVGVYDDTSLSMQVSKKLVEELTNPKIISLDIYLSDRYDTAETRNKILETDKYTCTYQLESLKKNVSNQTSFFTIALILVGVILTIISIALLNSYAKISVIEKRRDLAIIRCLGATNKDLLGVLIFDSVVISLLSIFLSFGITFVINLFLPKIFNTTFINYSYPWLLSIIIGSIFVLLTMLVTSLHFIKISRKMPADLLKG